LNSYKIYYYFHADTNTHRSLSFFIEGAKTAQQLYAAYAAYSFLLVWDIQCEQAKLIIER